MAKPSTLVVVADGGTARFFTWEEASAPLSEHQDLRMEVPPSKGERGPAPRVQDSVGGQRHKLERRLTAHQANENKFLVRVAEQTESLIGSFPATSVILCAPPKALGLLRAALAGSGRGYVLVTLNKDLTKETAREIDQHVRTLRPVKHVGA